MGSTELETLDQLLAGAMPLSIIRRLYSNETDFLQGMLGLVSCGDARLLSGNDVEVPHWRWRGLFTEGKVLKQLGELKLEVTIQAARRVS